MATDTVPSGPRVLKQIARSAPGAPGVLLLYLLSRLSIAAATATVNTLNLSGIRCGDTEPRPIEGMAALARCWDATWYLRLAAEGYPHSLPADGGPTTLAFFPGYPALIAAGDAIGLGPLFTGVAVSLAGGAVAVLLVLKLGQAVGAPEAGRTAAVVFAFFPGTAVFSWAYTEALAAALAGACLLFLHRRRWLFAGIAALLAGTVRADVGLALTVACAVAALLALRNPHRTDAPDTTDTTGATDATAAPDTTGAAEATGASPVDRTRRAAGRDLKALIAPALAPLGPIGYLIFVWIWTGSPGTWNRTQAEGWDQHMDWGRKALTSLGGLYDPLHSPSRAVMTIAVVFMAVALVALARFRHTLPLPWLAYTAVLIVVSLVSSQVGFRPRAEVLLLPAFVAIGLLIPPKALTWVVPVLAALQVIVVVLWLGASLIAPP